MMERTIRDYLEAKTGIPTYLEVPVNAPQKFIVVDKTGSRLKECIYSMTVAIQSYDTTKAKASALNEKVKEKMLSINELDKVAGVRLNTDYPFPDTNTKRYRYQSVFDLTHY